MASRRRLPLSRLLRYFIKLREKGFTIKEIGEITGYSERWLLNLEKIRKRPVIRDAVLCGLIGSTEALEVLKLSDDEVRRFIRRSQVNVREILGKIANDKAIAKAIASKLTYRDETGIDPLREAIKAELREIFGRCTKTLRLTQQIYELASKAGLSVSEATEIVREIKEKEDIKKERPGKIVAWVANRIRERIDQKRQRN